MSSQFHNRLVGTIVIVALGVIFLPDILDGKKERVQEEFTEIPLRPVITQNGNNGSNVEVLSAKQELKNKLTNNADNQSLKDQADDPNKKNKVDKTDNSVEKKAPKPAANQNNNNQTKAIVSQSDSAAWTVQLGSFRDAENAKSLIQKLRKKGYSAYSLPQRPTQGQLTKVFVGPDISIDKINQLQMEVEKITRLKAKVIPFDPLES